MKNLLPRVVKPLVSILSRPGWLMLACVALFPAAALAFTTTTIPIGFIRQSIAGAPDALTPALTPLSIPFYPDPSYSGRITTRDSSESCSLLGANFSPNQFATAPSYLRVKSGACVGRLFLITSNTTNQVSLQTRGYSLVGANPAANELLLLSGDIVEIVPAHTLGTLFGTSSVELQTGVSADLADNVLLFDGSAWQVYFHDGSSWKRPGSSLSQNDTVVASEFALFVVRRAASPIDLFVAGTVPSTTEFLPLPAPGAAFLANRFPCATTLADFALPTLPNWKAGLAASASDQVLLWTGTTWGCFYFNGSHWRRAGSLRNADNQGLPAGSGVLISRTSTAPNSTLSLPLPYSIAP